MRLDLKNRSRIIAVRAIQGKPTGEAGHGLIEQAARDACRPEADSSFESKPGSSESSAHLRSWVEAAVAAALQL